MRTLVLLTLLAGATACQNTAAPPEAEHTPAPVAEAQQARPDLRKVRTELIAAGNKVGAALARKGVVEGMSGALAGNVLFLAPRNNTLQGKQAAINYFNTDPSAPSKMRWEILKADVSNDGTEGYTWAGGPITADFGTGAAEVAAFFLIYWRKGPGGHWRIAALDFNLGGPQTGPLPDGFATPTSRQRKQWHSASVQRLFETDAAFSAASVKHGTGPAFQRFAAPNGMVVGGGQFIYGPDAIGEGFASEPGDNVYWTPTHGGIAPSGDLGFTIGDATFELTTVTFHTKYLTIWQKQDDGKWRFPADFGSSRPAPAP
jgi:ketosteroid isomerase-like protein